jgi:hypothetical protein
MDIFKTEYRFSEFHLNSLTVTRLAGNPGKGIVSQDWGELQMVSLDRYEVQII